MEYVLFGATEACSTSRQNRLLKREDRAESRERGGKEGERQRD